MFGRVHETLPHQNKVPYPESSLRRHSGFTLIWHIVEGRELQWPGSPLPNPDHGSQSPASTMPQQVRKQPPRFQLKDGGRSYSNAISSTRIAHRLSLPERFRQRQLFLLPCSLMEDRRSSWRVQRLLVRVHSAENLRHVSSQGTYCKVSLDAEPLSRGSTRGSLKRLLQSSSHHHHHNHPSPAHDSETHARQNECLDPSLPRLYKTQVHKAMRHNPVVWKEKFALAVWDAMTEVLTIRIKSARLLTAPSIGTCSIPLRDVPSETTADQWINLCDNRQMPAGRVRIQLRLVRPSSTSLRGSSNSARLTLPLASPSSSSSLLPHHDHDHPPTTTTTKPTSSSRQSTPLSQSLMDGRGSWSTTTTNDSIVSDGANDRCSAPVSHRSFGPESTCPCHHAGRSPRAVVIMPRTETHGTQTQRDTALSTASRGTTSNDELDLLASKYMARAGVTPPVPEQAPVVHDVSPTAHPVAKDDRSPRTTTTTTGSSDEENEENDAMTVEFEFDTGHVRPSTRLPSHVMRWTSARSSMASRVHLESENEVDEQDEDESELEDDEMDPDGDPDEPRVVLRNTVTKLLSRHSVNVIMDEEEGEEEEEDEDEDVCFLDPLGYDELPILDLSKWLTIEDIDCTDSRAAV